MTEAETTSVDGSDAFGDVGSDAPGDSTPAMALWMSFGRLRWVPCRARIAADGRRVEVDGRDEKVRDVEASRRSRSTSCHPCRYSPEARSRCRRKPPRGRDASSSCPDADAVAAATRAIASADERDETRDGSFAAAARLGALVETSRVLRFQTDEQARRWKDAVSGAARVARRADAADADAAALEVVARSARETRACERGGDVSGTVRVALDGTVLGVAQNHGDTRGGEPHRRRAARSRGVSRTRLPRRAYLGRVRGLVLVRRACFRGVFGAGYSTPRTRPRARGTLRGSRDGDPRRRGGRGRRASSRVPRRARRIRHVERARRAVSRGEHARRRGRRRGRVSRRV